MEINKKLIDLKKIGNFEINKKEESYFDESDIIEDEAFTTIGKGIYPKKIENNKIYFRVLLLNDTEEINLEKFFVKLDGKLYEKHFSKYKGHLLPKEVVNSLNEKNDLYILKDIEENNLIIPYFSRLRTDNPLFIKYVDYYKGLIGQENMNKEYTIEEFTPIVLIKTNKLDVSYKLNKKLELETTEKTAFSNIKNALFNKDPYGKEPFIKILFISNDINRIIYESNYLSHCMIYKLRENNSFINIKDEFFNKYFPTLLTTFEANDKINAYLGSKMLPNFRVEISQFVTYTYEYSSYNVKTGRTEEEYIREPAFMCNVYYKKDQIIGNGSYERGWVYISADGTMKMVHSAWCQRATAWGKEAGQIDQRYNSWDFATWISGPFAEKINLKMDEFEFVFMGNKQNPEATKRELLKKLAHVPI